MKILICPLNWGLGHATRCVPLIRKYIAEGQEVVLAADGYPLQFLKLAFPQLATIEFPSYSITYSAGKSQVGAMARNLPNIFYGIYREHSWLRSLLEQEHFDLIISDNRFGLWTKKTQCIYMTHQLMIKMPRQLKFLEPVAWWLHSLIIKQYTSCWIPDYKGENNLSGDLAHKYPLPHNAAFIGPQSRFSTSETYQADSSYELVVLISGIEPQRTLFENALKKQYEHTKEKMLIVCGKPTLSIKKSTFENIQLTSHVADAELAGYLIGCKKIIARSGYSTIMDLQVLDCLTKVEFIPTPGQTEQEYLAEYFGLNYPVKSW